MFLTVISIKWNSLDCIMTQMRVVSLDLLIQKIANFPLSHSNADSQLMLTPWRIGTVTSKPCGVTSTEKFDHTWVFRCRGIGGMRSFSERERRWCVGERGRTTEDEKAGSRRTWRVAERLKQEERGMKVTVECGSSPQRCLRNTLCQAVRCQLESWEEEQRV